MKAKLLGGVIVAADQFSVPISCRGQKPLHAAAAADRSLEEYMRIRANQNAFGVRISIARASRAGLDDAHDRAGVAPNFSIGERCHGASFRATDCDLQPGQNH